MSDPACARNLIGNIVQEAVVSGAGVVVKTISICSRIIQIKSDVKAVVIRDDDVFRVAIEDVYSSATVIVDDIEHEHDDGRIDPSGVAVLIL